MSSEATRTPAKSGRGIKILAEIRPALDGYAGIPQETRLLTLALSRLPSLELDLLLQHPSRFLANGSSRAFDDNVTPTQRARIINAQSRVIASLADSIAPLLTLNRFERYKDSTKTKTIAMVNGYFGKPRRLGHLNAKLFPEFLWQQCFSKSLDPISHDELRDLNLRVGDVPWGILHRIGLHARSRFGNATYVNLDTSEYDIFVSQTPFPAKISPTTKHVVRYHDTIPVTLPHTIADRAFHQASHYVSLEQNVLSGAFFSCVSEATRQSLLTLFPMLENRSSVIPNIVAEHFYSSALSDKSVVNIVKSRYADAAAQAPTKSQAGGAPFARMFRSDADRETFLSGLFESGDSTYFLVVSTLEPRKNHAVVIDAMEQLTSLENDRTRLIFVGSQGWDTAVLRQTAQPLIASGRLLVLHGVPISELKVLYRGAAAVICPSIAEGFDYSGIEAMACGVPVIASDIDVHREVYGPHASYFRAHRPDELLSELRGRMGRSASTDDFMSTITKARDHAAEFRSTRIEPRWQDFLTTIASR